MKIYLDDVRPTPIGFHRTYFVQETIDLILANEGNVEVVSLDNDLGIGYDEGKKVMQWIEEQAFKNTLQPIPNLIIHTDNSCAHDEMMTARYNAWEYWQGHGWDRYEVWSKDYTD
jgi:hypothetical protein